MDSDEDNFEDLYDEQQDASKHSKLVEKVLKLNKTQQLKKPSRTEPTLQVSEFDLVKSITGEKDSVNIGDLVKSLKDRKSKAKITEKVKKSAKTTYTLPKPLEKPQADKIRRGVAYEKTRLQLDKWEALVTSNRAASHLKFPLDNDVKIDKKEQANFSQMWTVKSKLQQELDKIDPPKVEEYQINLENDDDGDKFPLTMKEMVSRRKEAAKLRAFQGYQEAKARRQNKIKSKKYHRLQKKERIKQKLKEFEQLQKTDPEAALKKLEEIDNARAEERFSLRHKSTGQWARSKQVRAKYDKESRQVLAKQLTISKELTQKVKNNDSDEEDDKMDEGEGGPDLAQSDPGNPWVNGIKPDQEVTDFVGNYRKYWAQHNGDKAKESEVEDPAPPEDETTEKKPSEEVKDKKTKKPIKKKTKKKKPKKEPVNESQGTSEWEVSTILNAIDSYFDEAEQKIKMRMLKNVETLKKKVKQIKKTKGAGGVKNKKIDLTMSLQTKRIVIDEEMSETPRSMDPVDDNSDKDLTSLKKILGPTPASSKNINNIDPNEYIKVAKPVNLSTAVPDISTTEDNEEADQQQIISEAFEDDDIVQDFNADKRNEIDRDKPKNIDLNLPGWGSWGGTNIKVGRRKRRRFIVKFPQKLPRRDDNKGNLIVNEKGQSKVRELMVSELPFPFTTVKDFEASIRAPLGRTFVPETAFKKLTRPAVVTRMGAIIDPISKDVLLNK